MSTTISVFGKHLEVVGQHYQMHAAVLNRLAMPLDIAAMAGKRTGTTYEFVIDKPSAMEFGGSVHLSSAFSQLNRKATVRKFGHALACGDTDRKLSMGDEGQYDKLVGAVISNEAVDSVLADDLTRIRAKTASSANSGITKALFTTVGQLKSKWKGKFVAVADPVVSGEIFGDGRNAQPIAITETTGDTVQYKLKNIDEVHEISLPVVHGIASTVSATIAAYDSSASRADTINKGRAAVTFSADCGYDAGDFVVVGSAGKNYIVKVTNNNGLAGESYDESISAQVTGLTGTGAADYYAVMGWGENCRVIGYASDCLDVSQGDGKKIGGGENVSLAFDRKAGTNDFEANYQWATALASQIVDNEKAFAILVKIA